MVERIDRSERLLNLVVALLGTRRAISRATIREVVPGYSAAVTDSAFERMFERDKDELRGMGIPIETVTDDSGDVLGYRIDQARFSYVDVRFTAAEFAVLGAAAQAWEQAALGPVARKALLKLRPMVDEELGELPGDVFNSAHVTASESALLPLMKAVREGLVVEFSYVSSGSFEPQLRRVEPWGVVCRSGHWYLMGFDHNRSEQRTFRLSRFTGTCRILTQTCSQDRPTKNELANQLARDLDALSQPSGEMSAHIRIHSPHGAELMRIASRSVDNHDGTCDVWVEGTVSVIVSALVRSMPFAQVMSPAELTEAVTAHVRGVQASHSASI